MISKKLKNRSGQMRVTEALFAASAIVAALFIGISLVRQQNPYTSRYETNLEVIAYDVLDTFAREGVPDKILFGTTDSLLPSSVWEPAIKITLQGVLPHGLAFNFEIYNVTYDRVSDTTAPVRMNTGTISNVESDPSFVGLGKVATASRIYTCKKLWVLILRLSLVQESGR